MLYHKKVVREAIEPASVTCNRCGKGWRIGRADGMTTLRTTYGFGSEKDGSTYLAHICEECMDAIYATFTIPPQILTASIWGEDPPDPVTLIDDHQKEVPDTEGCR